MTAAELLRQRAAKMRHAVVFDRVIDADGRVEAEREFHYLSCRRCELERQAEFIEKSQGTK
jgi:DNA-binding GntR family transcriptional regulator